MQIPKDLLKEINYEGSRLIEINDETVKALQEQLDAIQKEVNPVLDRLQENFFSKADGIYAEINELNEKIKPLKEQLKAMSESNKPDTDFIDSKEQEAMLIKNKMQPLILNLVKEELGEFETAKHTVVKDDKVFVEVIDEIEEKVKAIRASKSATTK
jgi:peptidoglycan hydrolase CwlO-like protein